MRIPIGLVTAIVLGVSGSSSPATARASEGNDTDALTPVARPASARDAVGSGLFLSGVEPARATPLAGSGLGVAGFDGARHTSFFSASAEVALARWLVLHTGVIYRPSNTDDRAAARPSVALRASLLDQARAGVDLAISIGYSQERLAAEGGILRVGAAVGRTFDRLSLIGNASFDSDPDEGDDRDGTLGGALLYRTLPGLHVGAQGSFRRDLGSTDPRRLLRKDADYDFAVGPVATYAREVLVFTLQTGVAGVKGTKTSDVGLLALGGLGAAF
jgi:hypothetical protein